MELLPLCSSEHESTAVHIKQRVSSFKLTLVTREDLVIETELSCLGGVPYFLVYNWSLFWAQDLYS